MPLWGRDFWAAEEVSPRTWQAEEQMQRSWGRKVASGAEVKQEGTDTLWKNPKFPNSIWVRESWDTGSRSGDGRWEVSHPSSTHPFFPCLGQNPERDMFSFQRTGEATLVCHHPPRQQPISPLQILEASSATCISTPSSKGVEASRAMRYNGYN